MLSGGMDSAAALLRLLTESTEELRVHHVRLANREGRAAPEQAATERIVAWLRERHRPFRYSESGIDFSALRAIPIDYLAIAYAACQVAIDTPGCNRIALGTLARDTDEANRSSRQRQVFGVMYECYRARRLGEPAVEWVYPVHGLDKRQVAALLPRELLELTWSCRTPRPGAGGFRPCGECKACRVRAAAGADAARAA
jgi:7-cyano-7-deazaguanine synthase in queuosine biosynthesis